MFRPITAEMGNLLSLYPKIHCLNADAQVRRGVPNGQREFFSSKRCHRASVERVDCGEVLCIHAFLYGIRSVQNKSLEAA